MKQTTPIKKVNRNSSVEILRIASMLMIIYAHLGSTGEFLNGANRVLFVLGSSTLTAGLGVSCFMLFTGYYSNTFSTRKLAQIIGISWVSSVVSRLTRVFIDYLVTGGWHIEKKIFIKSFIPIISNEQWYISCYVFTLILSPFLYDMVERLSKKRLEQLLVALILLFYAMPTVFYFQLTNDKGKGIVYMITAYILGRYLSKYKITLKSKTLIIGTIVLMAIQFIGNMGATILRDKPTAVFSRECSIFTLFTAVALVMLANNRQIYSKGINKYASFTLYVMFLSNIFRFAVQKLEILEAYYSSPYYILICIAITIAISILSTAVAFVIQYPARLVVKIIAGVIDKFTAKLKQFGEANKEKISRAIEKL